MLEACHRFIFEGRGNTHLGLTRSNLGVYVPQGLRNIIKAVKERERLSFCFSGAFLRLGLSHHSSGSITHCSQTQPGRTPGGCISEIPGAGTCVLVNDLYHFQSLSGLQFLLLSEEEIQERLRLAPGPWLMAN